MILIEFKLILIKIKKSFDLNHQKNKFVLFIGENRKLESFESNLVIGVYYLKNKKYYLADKYFKKLIKQKNERQTLRGLLSISINNWVSFLKIDKKQALELTNNLPKNQ